MSDENYEVEKDDLQDIRYILTVILDSNRMSPRMQQRCESLLSSIPEPETSVDDFFHGQSENAD